MKYTPEEYIEARLLEWAEWYNHGNHYGIGYPPTSIEYRLLTEGHIQRNPGPHPLPCHESAEEMEKLLGEMATFSEELAFQAFALRYHYINPRQALRPKAKKLNMPYSRLKIYLDLGKQWLMGRLSSNKQFK